MANPIALTEQDVRLLQDMLDRERRQRRNTANRPAVDQELGQAPDVYIALTPASGIDARAGNVLGFADCAIHRVVHPNLTPVGGLTRRVYNLALESLPGNTWIPVTRDKWGAWLAGVGAVVSAEPDTGTGTEDGNGNGTPGTGTSTGTGIPGQCGSALLTLRTYRCEEQSPGETEGTAPPVSHLNEYLTAVVIDFGPDGCLRAVPGGEVLLGPIACCDTSCLEEEEPGTGTGTSIEPDTGTGTSIEPDTGTGTGTGLDREAVCADADVANLALTIITDGGDCSCINVNDYPLLFVGGSPTTWSTDSEVPECEVTNQYNLTCDGEADWQFNASTATCYSGGSWTLVFSRADPFELQFERSTNTSPDATNCPSCPGTPQAILLTVIITKL